MAGPDDTQMPSFRAMEMLGYMLASAQADRRIVKLEKRVTEILIDPAAPQSVRMEFYYDKRNGYIPVLDSALMAMAVGGVIVRESGTENFRITPGLKNYLVREDRKIPLDGIEMEYLAEAGRRLTEAA